MTAVRRCLLSKRSGISIIWKNTADGKDMYIVSINIFIHLYSLMLFDYFNVPCNKKQCMESLCASTRKGCKISVVVFLFLLSSFYFSKYNLWKQPQKKIRLRVVDN